MRLPLGIVCATPGALALLCRAGLSPAILLARHQAGDWGEVAPEDALENDRSVIEGFRVLSSYCVSDGRIWVITEADRSATTLLLPEDY